MNSELLTRARDYIRALENGVTGDDLARFFAPDVVQTEFPNRLIPQGATRDLAALLQAAERGQEVMSAQRFEILNELAADSQVALEIQWTGTVAVALGSLNPGDEMKARFAVFLQYRDDLIVEQRNYDCFDAW